MNILFVAFGSALGGACRYLVGILVPVAGGFPWATLCVNVLGSLVFGVVSGALSQDAGSAAVRAFAVVGFCGGFTTFSTFSNESLRMVEASQWGMLAAYLAVSVLSGLAAVWLGLKLASQWA